MSKKDEKPKGPKLSAKDKKKLKELQKKEEVETKAKEIAERTFKAHEKERNMQEKFYRLKRQVEQTKLEEEVERTRKEAEEFKSVWADFCLRMDLSLGEYAKQQNWDNIIVESTLPNVNSEADINSFLSSCRENEDEIEGGEIRKRDIDSDFIICTQAIQLANMILLEMDKVREDRAAPYWTARAKSKLTFHRKNLWNFYSEIQQTFDRLTSNVMQYMDKYVDEADEQPLTLCKAAEEIKYGLWCGNKAARVRSVDFAPLNIVISPKDGAHLPKQLNLMNNVALRVIQYTFDPMLPVIEDDKKEDSGLELYALGGAIVVETISVPQPAKHVKQWTLRLETQLAHDVQQIQYPSTTTDAAGAPPPIKISFQVPPKIVVRNSAPVMGIWVSEIQCWLPEGTSEFQYDRSTRRATFLTQSLTKMAIIQEKGFDVPYERWFMYPVDSESVTFVIEGKKRNDNSDREVHILIRNNMCKLLNPQDPELQYLREQWYTPATLLRLLSNSGFNFVLQESDSAYTPDILPKTWVMENKVYDDMALFCTTFEFASSYHNKCGEDPNMCLFRTSKRMRDLTSSDAFTAELKDDEQWYTVRYERDRCTFTKCKESSVEANLEELPDHEVHLNLYMIMRSVFGPDMVDQCISASDLLLQNAVKQLLTLIRPLTWG